MKYLRTKGTEEAPKESLKRELWTKIEIIPGIEISVRRDVEETLGRKINEIIRVTKSIIKEETKGEHEKQ